MTFDNWAWSSANRGPSCDLTIPAVTENAVMFLYANTITAEDITGLSFSIDSTGSDWTQVGPTKISSAASSGFYAIGALYSCVAGASETSKVVTVSSNVDVYWALSIVAYTDADISSPVDVFDGIAIIDSVTHQVTTPIVTTEVDDDWAIYFGGSTDAGSSVTPPTGTQRLGQSSAQGVGTQVVDSNGSVGPAGTSIGGGTFVDTGGASNWWTAFTVGLKPPVTGSSVTGVGASVSVDGGIGSVNATSNASIWDQAAVTVDAAGGNPAYTNLSTIFNVAADKTLAGVWFYSPSGISPVDLPIATAIFEVGNTTPLTSNASPSWSGAAGSGWVKTTNETAITLSPGTDYIVSILGPAATSGNWFVYDSASVFPVTNGDITAPASSGALTNSPYTDGSNSATIAYPTSSSAITWYIDIALQDSSSVNASVTGVAASVSVDGGIGSASSNASATVTGVGASITVDGGIGSVTATKNVAITGVGAAITVTGGIGVPGALIAKYFGHSKIAGKAEYKSSISGR